MSADRWVLLIDHLAVAFVEGSPRGVAMSGDRRVEVMPVAEHEAKMAGLRAAMGEELDIANEHCVLTVAGVLGPQIHHPLQPSPPAAPYQRRGRTRRS